MVTGIPFQKEGLTSTSRTVPREYNRFSIFGTLFLFLPVFDIRKLVSMLMIYLKDSSSQF